jgi:restriction endonuclease S subunit
MTAHAALQGIWPSKPFGELCALEYGVSLPSSKRRPGLVPVYGSNGIVGTHDKALAKGPAIVIGRKGSIGEMHLVDGPFWPIDTTYFTQHDSSQVDLSFLLYFLATKNLRDLNKATGVPGLNREDVYRLLVPLPPLDEQKRIVRRLRELEKHLAYISGANDAQCAKIDSLTHSLIAFLLSKAAEWPRQTIVKCVVDFRNGYGRRPKGTESGPIVLRIADVSGGRIDLSTPRRGNLTAEEIGVYSLSPRDVVFIRVNGSLDLVGRCIPVGHQSEVLCFNDHLMRARLIADVEPRFFALMVNHGSARQQIIQAASTSAGQKTINQEVLSEITIPMPPLADQMAFVAKIEAISSQIDRSASALRARTELLEGARVALLRAAFSGTL